MFWVEFNYPRKMVSTRMKKHQNTKLISQLNETLIYFVIGYDTNAEMIENDCFEPQTSGLFNSFIILGGSQSVKSMQVTIKLLKELLPTNLGKRLTMLLQLSKIESVTRFWQPWTTW